MNYYNAGVVGNSSTVFKTLSYNTANVVVVNAAPVVKL
jgi:hypothetical protein